MHRWRAIVRVRSTVVARAAALLLVALTVLPFTAPFAVFDATEYTEAKSAAGEDLQGKDVHDVGLIECGGTTLVAPLSSGVIEIATLTVAAAAPTRAFVLRI